MTKEKGTRRNFFKNIGISAGTLGFLAATGKAEKMIQGFDDAKTEIDTSKKWQQKFSRKVRVGIVGYGVC